MYILESTRERQVIASHGGQTVGPRTSVAQSARGAQVQDGATQGVVSERYPIQQLRQRTSRFLRLLAQGADRRRSNVAAEQVLQQNVGATDAMERSNCSSRRLICDATQTNRAVRMGRQSYYVASEKS